MRFSLLRTILAVALLAGVALAHDSGRVSGRVFNAQNGRPIPDANIVVRGTPYGAASQSDGYFYLDSVPDGRYDLTITVLGYAPVTLEQVSIQAGTVVEVPMTPQAVRLNPVVVTASGKARLASELSVATQVLDARDLREQGGDAMGEVLSASLGGLVNAYGGLAGVQSLTLRGSSASQVLVLLDGQRLNSAQDGGAELALIPAQDIERVELVRGGHSALYGSDAVGGVVHIITRETLPESGFRYGFKATGGSFGLGQAALSFGKRLGAAELHFSASRLRNDGDFEYTDPFTGDKVRRRNNDYLADQVGAKLRYAFSPNHGLRLVHQSLWSERGSAGSLTFGPTLNARLDGKRQMTTLESSHRLGDRLQVETRLFTQFNRSHYANPDSWMPENDTHDTRSKGFRLQSSYALMQGAGLDLGVEHRREKLESTQFDEVDRNTTSAYAQVDVKRRAAGLEWHLSPALRHDDPSDFDGRWSPRVGVQVVRPGSVRMGLRANVGRSFRAPTFNDLYWPEDDYTKGNPDLKPETAKNMDMGLFTDAVEGRLQAEATWFRNDFENLIVWGADVDWKWMPMNVGEARVQGLESRVSFRLPQNRAHVSVGYTRLDSEDRTDGDANEGKALTYRPENKWDLAAGVVLGSVECNLTYQVVGRRYTAADNSASLPAYRLLGGNIGLNWAMGSVPLGLSLQGFNLLNKEITIMDGYPTPGREWRLSFSVGA